MNKRMKTIIAAAMSVTMMAAAAAPAGSLLAGITPVKSITASASLGGEFDFSHLKTITYDGQTWSYGLNSSGTQACLYQLKTAGKATTTCPSWVPNNNNNNVPVRAMDFRTVYNKSAIWTLVLPTTLQKLDHKAVEACSHLETVRVRSTLYNVEKDSFYNNIGLCKADYTVAINSFEMFNSAPMTNIYLGGYMYPIYQVIAGQPALCPYENFSTYITNNHWKFQNAIWMNGYISTYASYYASVAKRNTDNLPVKDAAIIHNIYSIISERVNTYGARVSYDVTRNGDTAFFFNAYNADSLGVAKAFDLIANAAGYQTMILNDGYNVDSPYEFLNVIWNNGYVYTVDAMRQSCMESPKRLRSFFGNQLPADRFYLKPEQLDSTLHTTLYSTNSSTNNMFVAVPYRFRGDVNEDGVLNTTDKNLLNNPSSLTAAQKFRADFNMDGRVNSDDKTAMESFFGIF